MNKTTNQVVNEMPSPPVSYRRISHAAHYPGVPNGGHDLEEWTYAQPTRLPRPDGLPTGVEYHAGFVSGGVQYWVYLRRAPLSPGHCERCGQVVR